MSKKKCEADTTEERCGMASGMEIEERSTGLKESTRPSRMPTLKPLQKVMNQAQGPKEVKMKLSVGSVPIELEGDVESLRKFLGMLAPQKGTL